MFIYLIQILSHSNRKVKVVQAKQKNSPYLGYFFINSASYYFAISRTKIFSPDIHSTEMERTTI